MQTIAITPTERQPVPRPVGTQYVISNYLGAFDDRRAGPHAFLVEQRSPKLGAHFHEVDQFQVVLEGAGTLGRDRMVRDVPHCSDADTSCGPICTVTPDGLTYLTLRREATIGANVMPESREPTSASDGYAVVFDGALDLRGRTYPPGSLACFGSLTGLTDARAGADGLTLAVLIFAPAL
jgi:hypothetical protein